MHIETHTRGDHTISTDKAKLDIGVIHGYLSRSYWAEGIPVAIVQKSIENSLCFGLYRDERQVGFARVMSDFATFAYLADVFILEEERGKGLSKWLMECILQHQELQGLRSFALMTRDAQSLYARYGFKNHPNPERFMMRRVENIYKRDF